LEGKANKIQEGLVTVIAPSLGKRRRRRRRRKTKKSLA